MLSQFDRIENSMANSLMCQFGTKISIVPMNKRPNRTAYRDPSREIVTIMGVFYSTHRLSDIDKNSRIDRANKTKSMSYNNVSTKSIRVTVNICDLIYEPKHFDAVIRIGVEQAYEIIDIAQNGQSALDLYLSEVEGPFPVSY